MRGQLIVERDGAIEQLVQLDASVLTIGRLPDNGLSLRDPLVSRHHAEVRAAGGRVRVIDLGSANGTFVDGARLLPHHAHTLAGMERITVGPFTVRYRPQSIADVDTTASDAGEASGRELVARLAVFVGGWTPEAAAAVCSGEGIAREDMPDLLARMIERSLVEATEGPDGTMRHDLAPTSLEDARARFAASRTAKQVRGRHAAYYLELAERVAAESDGGLGERWPEALDGEQDNLRAALWWFIGGGDFEGARRLTRALGAGWSIRHTAAGRAWRARGHAGANRAAALAPGAEFGSYRIEAPLAATPLIASYRAYAPTLGCHRVLKVLLPDLVDQPGLGATVARSIEALALLRHPHLLPIRDCGVADGLAYLACDFVDGGDLSALAGAALPVAETAALLAPVAAALDYAHGRGVVHGLVKPANILRRRTDGTVLSDLGMAGIVEALQRHAGVSALIGTPAYMAPEQIEGKGTTAASDLYALAVVAYELVAGRPPFREDLPWAMLWAHVHTSPLPPSALRPALTGAAEAALLKGLAKRPEERYPSAESFAAALAAAAET